MKRRFSIHMIILLALVLPVLAAAWPNIHTLAASPVYVDDDGVCGGNAPCYTTIGAAVADVDPGGIINVYPGVYSGGVGLNKALTLNGANAGIHPTVGTHPTEVVGARGPESIITGSFYPTADNITIDGFTFQGTGARRIDTYADANNLHLTNNIFEPTGYHATTGYIQLGGGSHNDLLVDFNIFIDDGDHMFYFGGGPYDRMRFTGNYFNTYGEAIFWAASPLVDAVVDYNEFDGVYNSVPGDGSSYMNIGLGGNIQVHGNWFHDQFYTGFQIGIIGGSVTENLFENVYPYPGYWGTAFELWGGQYGTAVSQDVVVQYNTIRYNGDATAPIYGIRLRAPGTPPGIDGTTIHISNNCILSNGARSDALGIWNQADPTKPADAEDNWWGDASGPYHASLNPGGSGGAVGDYVDFDPWATAPNCTPAPPTSELTVTSYGYADGYVTERSETSEIGSSYLTKGNFMPVGDTNRQQQIKIVLDFDTSGLPAGATVIGAALEFKQYNTTGNPFDGSLGALQVEVKDGYFGRSWRIEALDFQDPADALSANTLAIEPGNNTWTSLDISDLAAFITAGRTQLRLSFQIDDNDNPIGDTLQIYTGDAGGSAPRLVLYYTVP